MIAPPPVFAVDEMPETTRSAMWTTFVQHALRGGMPADFAEAAGDRLLAAWEKRFLASIQEESRKRKEAFEADQHAFYAEAGVVGTMPHSMPKQPKGDRRLFPVGEDK